jgi:hypothetical protein
MERSCSLLDGLDAPCDLRPRKGVACPDTALSTGHFEDEPFLKNAFGWPRTKKSRQACAASGVFLAG